MLLVGAEGEIFQIGPVSEGFLKDFLSAANPSKNSDSLPFCLLPTDFSLLPTNFALLTLGVLLALELAACWLWTCCLYSVPSWSKTVFCLEDLWESAGTGLKSGGFWLCSVPSSTAPSLAFY